MEGNRLEAKRLDEIADAARSLDEPRLAKAVRPSVVVIYAFEFVLAVIAIAFAVILWGI